MPPVIDIPAEKQRQAYDYYVHHPAVSLQDIATFLGVSLRTFVRLRERWGWPLRKAALARSGGKTEGCNIAVLTAAHDGEAAAPSSLREAAKALVNVTRSHIDALAREQRSGHVADHDRFARNLAAYAKTLTTAQALLEQEGSRPDDAEHQEHDSRSLHELRDELACHLERVIAEEEARGGDGLLV